MRRAPRTRTSGRATRSTGGSPPTSQLETDPAIDAELRADHPVRPVDQTVLPEIPPRARAATVADRVPPDAATTAAASARQPALEDPAT